MKNPLFLGRVEYRGGQPALNLSPFRVYRGGCWNLNPRRSGVSNRNRNDSFYRYDALGFRLFRTPTQKEK